MPSKINSGKWGGVSQRVQTSSYMINKIWASIYNMIVIISKHCCFSLVTMLCLTLFDLMNYSTPGFLVLHYLPKFTQTHVHWTGMPSNHLSLRSSPALNISQHQGLFQWVSSSHQVAKGLATWYPSNEYSGLISFRIDWFDLLAVQMTLKSLL